ncbi:PREDICTED: C-type lectin domain family 2 member B-like [Calidris pugnax]|uniref:C-type lectin domain family 2 member B-like n=1 Tax=Calidris pugnax TaxID=198806 RepID=UPI00071E4105|nr:PREDICTED: C-type lectin domain family 2 member B-like [Calidris pugnax]
MVQYLLAGSRMLVQNLIHYLFAVAGVCVLVVSVLVALVLALAVAVAVLSGSGNCGSSHASKVTWIPGLGCGDGASTWSGWTAAASTRPRTCGGDPAVPVAPVLACPDGWVGYHNVCYYLSRDQGSWEWSQEQCSSRGASLAVLRREWELWFLLHLKGNIDYWIGLRRRGEHLEWVDGSSFNQTFEVRGEAECVYLNNHVLGSTDCSQHRLYVCSKPQVPR